MTSLTDSLGVIVAITVAGFILTLLRSLLNGLFGALDRVAPSMTAARAPSVEPGARASAAAPLGPGPTTHGSADAAREQAPPVRSYADVQWEHRERGDEDPPRYRGRDVPARADLSLTAVAVETWVQWFERRAQHAGLATAERDLGMLWGLIARARREGRFSLEEADELVDQAYARVRAAARPAPPLISQPAKTTLSPEARQVFLRIFGRPPSDPSPPGAARPDGIMLGPEDSE